MRIRLTAMLAVTLLASILLTACSSTPKQTIQYDGDPEMKASIKLMYPGGEEWFAKDYGDLFRAKYPNIEVTVIDNWDRRYKEVLEKEKPDVFALNFWDYKKLIEEDLLYDLDNLITNDAFNLDGMHSELVNFLRQQGGGKLYGLPPVFTNKAIYYNKDLFDKYNVPYPEDQMTWEELIQLAKRFPGEDGINGLYMESFSSLLEEVANNNSLSLINEKNMKVTVNTESFKKIFDTLLDAYEAKAVVSPVQSGGSIYDPFITGTSAMTVKYYSYIFNNIYWAKEERGDSFQLNWDVASAPVNDSDRETTKSLVFQNIFSVNAKSGQAQAAWELVKFVNSEEVAKAKSKTPNLSLLTRTDYIYNPEGKKLEVFYNKKPNMSWALVDESAIPVRFTSKLFVIIESEVKAVMAGVKTLDEALKSIEERGQEQLDKQLAEKSKTEEK
ncbi:Bacterial extracellular solute-binding protein [compost metagenome]